MRSVVGKSDIKGLKVPCLGIEGLSAKDRNGHLLRPLGWPPSPAMKVLFFVLLALHGRGIHAQWDQRTSIRHWGSGEGLSSKEVTALAQDSSGFLWVGTEHGLFRFDGSEFLGFHAKAGDTRALSNDQVTALAVSGDGTIWVGTHNGLCTREKDADIFKTVQLRTTNGTAPPEPLINFLCFDAHGRIVVGVEKHEAHVLDTSRNTWEPLRIPAASVNTSPAALAFASDSLTYFSLNGNGLSTLTPNGARSCDRSRDGHFPYPGHTLTAVLPWPDGRVFGGGWDNAMHIYRPQQGTHEFILEVGTTISFASNEIRTMLSMPNGELAVATSATGLRYFDTRKQKWSTTKRNLDAGTDVRALLLDRDGNLWAGGSNGLMLIERSRPEQQVYSLMNPLPGESITALFAGSNEHVGIVTDRRIWPEGILGTATSFGPFSDKLGSLKPYSALWITPDLLGVGTQRTLHVLDRASGKLCAMDRWVGPSGFSELASSRVNCIAARPRKGAHTVLAMPYGWNVVEADLDRRIAAVAQQHKPDRFENLVRKIVVDGKDRIWLLGSSRGLVELRELGDMRELERTYARYTDMTTLPSDSLSIPVFWSYTDRNAARPELDAWDLLPKADGTYWYTAGGALYTFAPNNAEAPFRVVLSGHSTIQGLASDRSGRIWMISDGGLLVHDPVTQVTRSFTAANGLHMAGLSGYIQAAKDGSLWASNGAEVLRWWPEHLADVIPKARTYLAHLSIFDRSADSLLHRSNVHLPHDRNFLFFTPGVVAPALAGPTSFTYHLDGYDKQWLHAPAGERIAYTGLPPGRYTLRLRPDGPSMDTDTNEATWTFTITAPWWRRAWFISLVFLVCGGVVYLVLRYRLRQRQRMQQVRDRIARDLHDDIGSTLGSISFFSELARQRLGDRDVDNAQAVMGRIGERSREMIGRMSDIVWSIDPKNDGGGPLAERMRLFAAEILGAKDIVLRFTCDPAMEHLQLDMVQRREFFLVLKEAVSNAAKHAQCSVVEIVFGRVGNALELSVSDNGTGIPTDLGIGLNGNGLGSMNKRAASLGGTLLFSGRDGGGTTIRLTAPVKRMTS